MTTTYAYYPGCSLHSTATEYNDSLRKVFSKLSVELQEPQGWVCCGASAAHSVDELLATALPAHSLLAIEDLGLKEVVVPCAACFQRFKMAAHEMQQSNRLEGWVEEALGKKYGYSVTVKHPVEIIEQKVASGEAADLLVRSLGDMKVACYYGCMLTRPPKVMQFDECEYPETMDRLITSLGGEALDWSYKTDCCGASLALNEKQVVLQLAKDILQDAVESEAEAIVVGCQLCQANLDMRQVQINAEYTTDFNIPILFFSQLAGLALGLTPQEMGIQKHMVNPLPLLEKYNLI
jgi:heterodisulfide reductase subunit B